MSATDELRRLLDGRGVEWGNVRRDGSESDYLTEWQFDNNRGGAVATEWAVGNDLAVTITITMTPQQAIDATLGRGECHVAPFMECSECGAQLDGIYGRYCPNCGRKVVDA